MRSVQYSENLMKAWTVLSIKVLMVMEIIYIYIYICMYIRMSRIDWIPFGLDNKNTNTHIH